MRNRTRLILAAGAIALALALLAWGGWAAFEATWRLAIGWTLYLARVAPKVSPSWDGVLTGLVCLALFSVGLHRALRWFSREFRGADPSRRPWSARWTAAIVVLIVVTFVAGIAATGVAHQTGWLIKSRGTLVELEARPRAEWGTETSVDHLKMIGISTHNYYSTNGGLTGPGEPLPAGQVSQSWMTDLLNYFMVNISGDLRKDRPWNAPENSAYFRGIVPDYLNPEIRPIRNPEGYALAHYAGNVHVIGRGSRFHLVGVVDTANTIVAGEVADEFKPWGDPSNLRDPGLGVNTVPGGFGGTRGRGAQFLFADGSVRFLRETTPPEILRSLSRPLKPAP